MPMIKCEQCGKRKMVRHKGRFCSANCTRLWWKEKKKSQRTKRAMERSRLQKTNIQK